MHVHWVTSPPSRQSRLSDTLSWAVTRSTKSCDNKAVPHDHYPPVSPYTVIVHLTARKYSSSQPIMASRESFNDPTSADENQKAVADANVPKPQGSKVASFLLYRVMNDGLD